MLAKLLKHELKALSRFLIPIHIIVLITSIIGYFTITLNASRFPENFFVLMLFTYVFILIAAIMGTYLIITVRFYKSLFTDEGYLTWTLPATAGQHLLSKVISSVIWGAIDTITMLFSVCLLFLTPDVLAQGSEITDFCSSQNIDFNYLIFFIIITFVLEILFGPAFLYICIATGQLFSNHRILGAVISYFILTTLPSMGVSIALFASGYLPSLFTNQTMSMNYFINYMNFIMQFTIIFSIIGGAVFYFITYYIMKKRLNLD